MVPSPATELTMFKTLSAFGVTAFSSVPFLFAIIEPMTWGDLQARQVYVGISLISAIVVLTVFRPSDHKELFGRLLAAAVASVGFVEPVAARIRPYMSDITLQDGAPVSAALPAAVFIGIVAWFGFAFIVWAVKSPKRAFRIVYWWKKPTWQTFDAIFNDDMESKLHTPLTMISVEQLFADETTRKKIIEMIQSLPEFSKMTPDTSKNGVSHGHPAMGVTLTPSQVPVNVVVPAGIVAMVPSDKTT